MPLDFMFQIHLMILLKKFLVMLLGLIDMKNNNVIYLNNIFIFLEHLVWSTVKL